MTNPTLYVVVPLINNAAHFSRLLDALRSVKVTLRLIVVDNASSQPEALEILANLGRMASVIVVRNAWNSGVSASWNIGIRIALNNMAEHILVCGSDTRPWPGCVERLYQLSTEGVLFITGTQAPYSQPETPILTCGPEEKLLAAPDFSFFMINRKAIEMVAQMDGLTEINVVSQLKARPMELPKPWDWGLFDERFYPAYFEDNDYHVRLKRAGVLALRDPGAIFGHDCSLSIRTHPDLAKINQEQTFPANHKLFVAKWGKPPQELDIPSAKPGNISDEDWALMSGGRQVVEVDVEEAKKNAEKVYGQYGVTTP